MTPPEPVTSLTDVLAADGEDWQVHQEGAVYVAVRRPKPTALHILVAYTPAELHAKIIAAH